MERAQNSSAKDPGLDKGVESKQSEGRNRGHIGNKMTALPRPGDPTADLQCVIPKSAEFNFAKDLDLDKIDERKESESRNWDLIEKETIAAPRSGEQIADLQFVTSGTTEFTNAKDPELDKVAERKEAEGRNPGHFEKMMTTAPRPGMQSADSQGVIPETAKFTNSKVLELDMDVEGRASEGRNEGHIDKVTTAAPRPGSRWPKPEWSTVWGTVVEGCLAAGQAAEPWPPIAPTREQGSAIEPDGPPAAVPGTEEAWDHYVGHLVAYYEDAGKQWHPPDHSEEQRKAKAARAHAAAGADLQCDTPGTAKFTYSTGLELDKVATAAMDGTAPTPGSSTARLPTSRSSPRRE